MHLLIEILSSPEMLAKALLDNEETLNFIYRELSGGDLEAFSCMSDTNGAESMALRIASDFVAGELGTTYNAAITFTVAHAVGEQ